MPRTHWQTKRRGTEAGSLGYRGPIARLRQPDMFTMVKQVSWGSPLLVKHTACNAEQFPQLLLGTVLTKEILYDVTAQNEMYLTLLTRSRTLLPSGQGIPSADSYKMVSFINLGKNQRIQSIIYYHWQEKRLLCFVSPSWSYQYNHFRISWHSKIV